MTTTQKTKMSFALRQELKDQFFKVAEDLEATPSALLNMMIKDLVNGGKVYIGRVKQIDNEAEVEGIDTSLWDKDIQKDLKILDKKAEKIFANLDV